MTKKQKQDTEQIVASVGSNAPAPADVVIQPPSVVAEAARAAAASTLAGKTISIDLSQETYFGVGDIWLSPERYWCVIPDNMTAQDYAIIERSLQAGKIKLGKEYHAPMEKASNIPEKYWLMIAGNGFENKKAKSEFAMLLRKGQDQAWTALEIVNFCLEKEKAGKNRKQVIALLTQVSKHYDGPVSLWEPPDTAEGIKKVTISADGTITAVTNSGTEVAKSVKDSPPPADHRKGKKTSGQAVNDLFK